MILRLISVDAVEADAFDSGVVCLVFHRVDAQTMAMGSLLAKNRVRPGLLYSVLQPICAYVGYQRAYVNRAAEEEVVRKIARCIGDRGPGRERAA